MKKTFFTPYDHVCFWISSRGRDLQGHLGADHVCAYITLGGAIFFDYMMARREGWKSRASSADTSAHNIDCGPKTDEACAYWGEPWTQRGKLVIVIVMFKMAQHQPCSRFREWSTLPEAIVLAEGEALAPFMSMQDLPARDALGTCGSTCLDRSSQTAKRMWNIIYWLWNSAHVKPMFSACSKILNTMMSLCVLWCCNFDV